MGNCVLKHDANEPTLLLQRSAFRFQRQIGKGALGKVWKVYYPRNKRLYAIKEMSKLRILAFNSVISVLSEFRILTKLNHNFIVGMHYAFQDKQNLYMVMDYLSGGDLRYYLLNYILTEQQAKFIILNIILGLQYLHKNNVIHRDIKPENIVISSRGYAKITDFGIARIFNKNLDLEGAGTPAYMPPEVLQRKQSTFAGDYYAVGVIAYELMMGERPYKGTNRKILMGQHQSCQILVRKGTAPAGWSEKSVDFVNKMIQVDPKKRLGYNGIKEIMQHMWFQDLNLKFVKDQVAKSPIIPEFRIMQKFTDWNEMFKGEVDQSIFKGYFFDEDIQNLSTGSSF